MTNELVLRSGYTVEALEVQEPATLRLIAPDGRICLKITLTPTGPEVELSSASLKIASEGDVAVECARFAVSTKGDIALASGGDLLVRAVGEMNTEAFAQRHRALRGDFALKANDDVTLDGERVRLNSPKPLPPQGTLKEIGPSAELIGRLPGPSEKTEK